MKAFTKIACTFFAAVCLLPLADAKKKFTDAELKLPSKKGACYALRAADDPKGSKWGLPVRWPESIPYVKKLDVKWNYSWNTKLVEGQPKDIEFVPQVWGAWGMANFKKQLQRDVIPMIKSGRIKRILAFNEPDKHDQSNMTYKQALEYWPELEKLGIPLCSPSPARTEPLNDGTSQGVKGTWMPDFIREADKRGYRVDYVGVHWYGGISVEDFKAKMGRLYKMYGKRPLILSEFAPANWDAKSVEQNHRTPAMILTFMKEILPWLQKTEWIAGYSWFSFGTNMPCGWSSALFTENGKLTACGRFYKSVTDENPNGDQSIKPDGDKPPKTKFKSSTTQYSDAEMKKKGLNPVYMGKSAGDLVGKSWRAMKKKNTKQMLDIMNAAVAMWGKQAKKQQAKLSSLPVKSAARKYEAL
ncbi:MAG: hypothetical protein HRT88_16735, partial [Lentisphaeraceae bacterium]|nr:hypothetical protein [Lentisphaeraceae bacterium]